MSSLWEDPGFVIVEAALTNTNIISSKCPNGPEEILQNEGFLFKNNNLNDLVDKFEKFLKTKENIRYKNKVTLKKRIKQYTQLHHYKKLIQIRKENSSLRTGSFSTLLTDGMVYSYLRSDRNSSIAVIINNDEKAHNLKIPFDKQSVIDLLTEREYFIKAGILEIELDAMSGAVLQ